MFGGNEVKACCSVEKMIRWSKGVSVDADRSAKLVHALCTKRDLSHIDMKGELRLS